MKTSLTCTLAGGLVLGCSLASTTPAADATPLPHLRRQGAATQLVVDGEPFLIRAGELGNSTGEPAFLQQYWPKLEALHLNTLLVPIYWNIIEPEQGKLDFTAVDALLADAREHNMRLVLLWFGTWKNSMSCYAPAWVKRDPTRFPRSRNAAGRALEILSPFQAANVEADARAFAALMRHLRETDSERHTVLMVQVENEIGMIPDARDHSPEAERQFAAPVPAELLAYLAKNADTLTPELRALWLGAGGKRAGTWNEVFGTDAGGEEVFMAWCFARYAQQVAARGKAEYALPMFVNAALIRPGHQPGQYPSAGPLPHLFDVWRAGAPAIDTLSPDIYFRNFSEWARRYARGGSALFIPEALPTPEASVNALFAFAGLNAIGFSPFGIETVGEPASRAIADSFDLVAQLTPLILKHQGAGTMVGLLPEGAEQRQPQRVVLGDYVALVSFERPIPPAVAEGLAGPGAASASSNATQPSGGLVIQLAADELLLAGTGITVTFQPRASGPLQAGILSVEEGHFVKGQWTHVRWLNGDQTGQGRHVRIEPASFGIRRVKLYTYQ
jgi:beta-galactosidase GanA